MNESIRKIKELLKKVKGDKKTAAIIIGGIIIIILILLSEVAFGSKKEKNNSVDAAVSSASTEETELNAYSKKLEEQLTQLISSISGVGKVKVMVTLESSAQSVYATSEKRTSDNDKNSYNNEYIIIKSGSSQEEALLINILQPKVRGVAVVCEGADSVYVKQRIIDTVSAVLDISSSNISITPMG